MLHGPSLANIFGHGKSRALPFPQLHAGRKDLDDDHDEEEDENEDEDGDDDDGDDDEKEELEHGSKLWHSTLRVVDIAGVDYLLGKKWVASPYLAWSRSCYVAVTPESSTSAHSLTSSYPVVAF